MRSAHPEAAILVALFVFLGFIFTGVIATKIAELAFACN